MGSWSYGFLDSWSPETPGLRNPYQVIKIKDAVAAARAILAHQAATPSRPLSSSPNTPPAKDESCPAQDQDVRKRIVDDVLYVDQPDEEAVGDGQEAWQSLYRQLLVFYSAERQKAALTAASQSQPETKTMI